MPLTRVQHDAWMDLSGPDQIVIPAIWEEEKRDPDTGWGEDCDHATPDFTPEPTLATWYPGGISHYVALSWGSR